MLAYMIIGKCEILNAKPESEEIISYFIICH